MQNLLQPLFFSVFCVSFFLLSLFHFIMHVFFLSHSVSFILSIFLILLVSCFFLLSHSPSLSLFTFFSLSPIFLSHSLTPPFLPPSSLSICTSYFSLSSSSPVPLSMHATFQMSEKNRLPAYTFTSYALQQYCNRPKSSIVQYVPFGLAYTNLLTLVVTAGSKLFLRTSFHFDKLHEVVTFDTVKSWVST